MTRLAVLLLAAASAEGQFFSLTTPGDASAVYFATPLCQKGAGQPSYGKLFRFDSRLALQESRVLVPPNPTPTGAAGIGKYSLSNPYNIFSVSVSSDGATLAVAASRDCAGDIVLCSKLEEAALTTVTANGKSRDFPGYLRLSANGRWAFGSSTRSLASFGSAFLVDLASGEQTRIDGEPRQSPGIASAGRPVSDDGTAVFTTTNSVSIYRGGAQRSIRMTGYDAPGEAVIDRFGGTVVYTVSHTTVYDQGIVVNDGSKKSLYIVPAGGNSRLLAEGGYGPSLSDDGSQILYLARMGGIPQVWVTDRFGFWPRQITRDPAGIQTATLSGDGKVVYATTQGGRLIKVAVATGEVTEAISRTPWFDSSLTAVPGQLSTFTGFGFADSDRTVTIQGKPSRVLGSNATTLWALVPQDVPVSTFGDYFRTLTLNAAPDSPFEGPRTSIGVNAEGAAFLYASPRAFNRMFAAHEDWSGLVSAEAPARPGEVIHAYATGLGATSPAVPFGAAAPAVEPLARSTDPFTCGEYGSSGNVVEVRYQGLAPGLTAVYQMDLLIPRDAAAGTLWIVCRTGQSPVQKSIGGTVPVK